MELYLSWLRSVLIVLNLQETHVIIRIHQVESLFPCGYSLSTDLGEHRKNNLTNEVVNIAANIEKDRLGIVFALEIVAGEDSSIQFLLLVVNIELIELAADKVFQILGMSPCVGDGETEGVIIPMFQITPGTSAGDPDYITA